MKVFWSHHERVVWTKSCGFFNGFTMNVKNKDFFMYFKNKVWKILDDPSSETKNLWKKQNEL